MVGTVIFIVLFGALALIPVVWAIVGMILRKRGFWPVLVGTLWALILLVITFIGIGTQWGGRDSDSESSAGALTCVAGREPAACQPDIWDRVFDRNSPGCPAIPAGAFCAAGAQAVFSFCERIDLGGRVMQPWATWSDLAFVAAGLWILWFMHRFVPVGTTRSGSTTVTVTADNPMLTISALSVGYALVVIFMGPPSMWFHASMKEWGGWFDSMSVVMWLSFNAFYVAYAGFFTIRGNGRNAWRPVFVFGVWGLWLLLFGLLLWFVPGTSLIAYFASGIAWGGAEVFYLIRRAALGNEVKYLRNWIWFVLNIVLLALTMGIWVVFNDEIVPAGMCRDLEVFPGHALFHILASGSTMLTYVSFASEMRR